MTETREPLSPAGCDLRDFPFMPLDVVRLRDSDLAAVLDGNVFRAAVLAWCAAWHQVPAASLPDDDAMIARLLGYGRDVKGWKRDRANGALRGFVKCADGRLYHPVVAEKAVEAWDKRQEHRANKEAWRRKKQRQREAMSETGAGDNDDVSPGTNDECPPGQDAMSQGTDEPQPRFVPRDNALKGQGDGQGDGQGEGESRARGVSGDRSGPRNSGRRQSSFEAAVAAGAEILGKR